MNAKIGAARRRCRGEQGASLVFMLAFLSALGVLGAAMLTVTFASFKNTQTTRHSSNRLYGADGGVDYGIQLLRDNTSYCPNTAAGSQTLPNQTINGKTVTVTCQTLTGTVGGSSGPAWPTTWPLIITGYNGNTSAASFKTGGSTGTDRVLAFSGGPTFNAGGFTFAGGSDTIAFDEIHQYNPYCTADQTDGNTRNPSVSGAWVCESPASYPVPDPNPTLAVPTANAPAPVTQGSCRIFFPGKYTSAPVLTTQGNYYFASGVYYFENAGTVTLSGKVFGGQPAPGDSQKMTTHNPCSSDATANALRPGSATGYGVKFVAGGNTRFSPADNPGTKIELFAREAPTGVDEGSDRVSIYAPKTAGPGYLASTNNAAFSKGGNAELVIHGLVYVPNSRLTIRAVANPSAANAATFGGGLVTGSLEIDVLANIQTVTVGSIPPPPVTPASDRTIVVTATSTAPGEASVTETAVVVFSATAGTPPSIQSWRRN